MNCFIFLKENTHLIYLNSPKYIEYLLINFEMALIAKNHYQLTVAKGLARDCVAPA
jgi:hypothetical protein